MPSLTHSLTVRAVTWVPIPCAGRQARGSEGRPVIQEEVVSDLLHHLDTHQSMGLGGSTQGSWQKRSQSLFPSFASNPA